MILAVTDQTGRAVAAELEFQEANWKVMNPSDALRKVLVILNVTDVAWAEQGGAEAPDLVALRKIAAVALRALNHSPTVIPR